MRHVDRWLGAAATLLAAVAVSGCGSSSEATSTQEWADGVCSAITTYSNSLDDAATSLKNSGLSQSSFQDAANNVTDATQTFASDVKDLGTPNTSAGEAARQTVDNLSSELQDDANAIKDAMSGSSSTLSAISSVSATLAGAQKQVSSAVSDLSSLGAKSELEKAFSEAQSCSSLPGLS